MSAWAFAFYRWLKRGLDVLAALFLLVAFSPLLGAVALSVRMYLGAPVLFRQKRPGLHGKPFTMLKFRTMTDERDTQGVLLPDAQRLTRLGRFLRATSLDELPELINVLKGDMSLVGPRPLLMQYLERYTAEQARRHEVRPGITGLAQALGRQSLPFSKRLELDVWYVDHLSLSLDLSILARTAQAVFRKEGVINGQDVADVDDIGLSTPPGPPRLPSRERNDLPTR